MHRRRASSRTPRRTLRLWPSASDAIGAGDSSGELVGARCTYGYVHGRYRPKFHSNVPRRPPAPSRRPGAMGDLISDRWWCNKRITDRQRLDAIKRATKVRQTLH